MLCYGLRASVNLVDFEASQRKRCKRQQQQQQQQNHTDRQGSHRPPPRCVATSGYFKHVAIYALTARSSPERPLPATSIPTHQRQLYHNVADLVLCIKIRH